MGRDHIPAGLQALIATGHFTRHTTIDITLTDGTQLFFSTIEKDVVVDGVPRSYLARLVPGSIGSLDMSLTLDMDQLEFAASNVNQQLGRTLTGATRRLDGALAVKGQLFINNDDPEEYYYDPQVPGELQAGDVTDEKVTFSFISEIDAVIVSGRLISEEFPTVAATSPNPIGPGTVPVIPPRPGTGGLPGRYDPVDPIDFPRRDIPRMPFDVT